MIFFTVAWTAVKPQWQRACVMESSWRLAVLRLGPAFLSSMLLATWACPQPRLPESTVESPFTWEKHCKLLTCLLIANTFPELKEVAKPLSFWAEGWASAYRQRSVLRAVMARAWRVQSLKCLQWPTIIWLSSGPERPPSNKESGEDHQPLMGRRGVGWNYSVVCSPYLCWRWRLCHAECEGCRGRMWEEKPRVCLTFVGFRSGSRRDQRQSQEWMARSIPLRRLMLVVFMWHLRQCGQFAQFFSVDAALFGRL